MLKTLSASLTAAKSVTDKPKKAAAVVTTVDAAKKDFAEILDKKLDAVG
jgi:hypothetical protein